MGVLYFVLFFFVILIPLVLSIIIPIYKSHYKATGKIINYDSNMRKFVYRVNLSCNDIINLLESTNDTDELSCSFDLERSVVRFSEYGSSREYYFNVKEYDDYSIFSLSQVALIGMQSYVPLKLNPFLVSKLQAEIIPFSQYH